MIKIVHMADCHLDSSLSGLPAQIADFRRHHLASAFSDALAYAAYNDTNILLIPGDLFDTPIAGQGSANQLAGFARSNPETYIFIAPGNHDSIVGNNYISALSAFPNIHIFKSGAMEKVDISELNVCVYGYGCVQTHNEERLLENFWAEDSGKINLMCFHGLLQGYGGHAPYNPITKDDIAQSGLDYIALGHVHTYSGIHSLGMVNYAYSGCLLGRGFDETGAKGFIAGCIDKGVCELEFIESNYPAFERVFVDCTGATDSVDIVARVRDAVSAFADASYVSIILEGYVRSDLIINRAVVANSVNRFIFVKVDDKTKPMQDYIKLSNEQSLRGMFIKTVLESGADEQTMQKAISLGLAALSGEELNMDEY